MKALGMKVLQWPHQSFPMPQGQFPIILILLFLGTKFASCETGLTTNGIAFEYTNSSLQGLQYLWSNWSGTPNVSNNLQGWRTGSLRNFPCQSLFYEGNISYPSWRGVQCTRKCGRRDVNDICEMTNVRIIGLSLSNASIIGSLPALALLYLESLTTLELTGNPNLSGPLPQGIDILNLNSMDLHDNGFNGSIPQWNFQGNLSYLDLSGNKLTGGFPNNQTSTMNALEVFKIGRNQLEGVIPYNSLSNNSKLKTLDISSNSFFGAWPSFINNIEMQYLDASGNQFQGLLPDLTRLSSLQTVQLRNVSGTITNPKFYTLCPKLLAIRNLSRNNFNGSITNFATFLNVSASIVVNLSNNQLSLPRTPLTWTVSNLGSIQELYLDDNRIEGVLDVIQILIEQNLTRLTNNDPKIGNLRILSLKNNKITHVKYDERSIANNLTAFRLQGNPYCNGEVDDDDGKRCYCKENCFNTLVATKQSNGRIIIISACISVAAIIIILSIVVGAILLKNRRYKQELLLYFQEKFDKFDIKPTIYSYNELRDATRDFHEANKLGQGGYGAVYKGVLPSGQIVAVKLLYMKTTQGLDEFSNEIVLITGMKHRNLVNLKGCCLRETARILVYEYVDNLDVDQILLGPERQVVSWAKRLKICLGIARGLNYLHADARPRVIHRDIKASNILLDRNLEPKIADFGLALLFPDEESHIMTIHIAGTKGYLAPEYAARGQLSDKVDVYSFGILVLEIICGRRNIDVSLPIDQIYLFDWAWKLNQENKLMELVDPSLQLSNEEEEFVQRVIKLALQCIQNEGERRPSMARIVSILQNDTNSDVTVLSGTSELMHSYKSGKSLKLNSGALNIVSENLLSSSNKNPYRRHGENLTIEEELNQIYAS